MKQLRVCVTYKEKEIDNHLAKLRAEREQIRRSGDKAKDQRWLGAICLLEDMKKKNEKLKIFK